MLLHYTLLKEDGTCEGEHSGGTATCSKQAECENCGESYGDLAAHSIDSTTGKCGVCEADIAVASVTIDGTTTYYETLSDAATKAQTGTEDTPATLKMEQDIDLGNGYLETFSGVFTFDLNGKTLSGSKDSWGTFSPSGGNVTIIDSGEDGTITNSTYHGVQTYDCTLTIEGGIFTGYCDGVNCSKSTVIINGGTFIGSNEYGVRADMGTVTINGGTITGTKYDLLNYESIITLGLGEDGVGATFPDGLEMLDDNESQPAGLALKDILGAGAAYWQGDKMIILTEGQTQITGGDVIIKAECTHTGEKTYVNNGDGMHKKVCTECGYAVTENHTLTYTANEDANTIIESCSANCGYTGTATISAEDTIYDGNAKETATVNYSEGWIGEKPTASYENNKNAGTATASITIDGAKAEAEFTIEKRELTLSLTDCRKGYDGTKLLTDFTTKLEGFVFYDEGSYIQPDFLDHDDVYDDVAVDAKKLTVILPDCAPGAYTTATVSGITLTGETAGNYTIAETLENVLIFGYSGWEFEVTKASVTITSLDQNVEQGAGLDQTAYTVNDLVDGHHLSGVVLEADGSQIRVNTEKVVITNADDVDVTEYFDITGYSEGIITETCQNHSFNADGFCAAGLCDVYEAAKRNDNGTEDEYDDYYEISNAGQLYWFAQRVNEYGENEIRAVLVADITVPAGREWIPILDFYGNFDGNFKTISGLYCTGVENAGLFGGGGYAYGTIRNVHLTNSTFEGSGNVGGIAGYHAGIIENCSVSNTVSVSGTSDASNSALLIGYNGGTISNCYAYGSSFVGYMYPGYGSIENCYFLSEANDEYGTVGMTAAQFASGEVAWLLQDGQESDGYLDENDEWVETEAPQVWGQTCGVGLPTLGGAKVYHNITGGCCEENYIYSYSNTAADRVFNHIFDENGFCVCGEYEEAVQNDDGYYVIDNGGKLFWFAQQVNNGNGSINGKLMKDITVNENVLNDDGTLNGDGSNFRTWTPIGNSSNKYTGTFTGNGKTISGLYFNNSSTNYVGLFGYVGEGGTVKNVGVVNSYFCGGQLVGGVVGYSAGTVEDSTNTGTVTGSNIVGGVVGSNSGPVKGCYNTGTVTGSINSVGGVVGSNSGPVKGCYNTGAVTGTVSGSSYVGGVVGSNSKTVENCYNTGAVTDGSNVGGVVGVNTGPVTNCYNTGTVSGSSYVGGVVGLNYSAVTNCYFNSNTYNGNPIGDNKSLFGGTYKNVEGKTAAQFASGEVAYRLQNGVTAGEDGTIPQVWGQNIDNGETKQTAPVFSDAKVYHGYADCQATAAAYTNAVAFETVIAHTYENGICTNLLADGKTVCGGYQPAVLNDENVYEISNAGQLYWFAALVNGNTTATGGVAQNKAANAVLTANIVVNTGVLKSDGTLNDGTFRAWTPIGTSYETRYTGTFDGGDKTISGLYFNDSTDEYVGLFGYVDGGTVGNVSVADSYFYGKRYVGGVVGRTNRGTFENCRNTGTVTGSASVGGVVGQDDTGTITNCHNTGSVSAKNGSAGGVVGRTSGTFENCHNTGTVTGSGTYVGGVVGNNTGTFTNCCNTGTVTGSSDRVGGVAGNNTGTVVNCWNTGSVTGSFNVGGVAGNNTGTVANCYYLTGCAADGNKTTQYGIGNGTKGSTTADVADSTTGMSAAQFASGEVAYKLSQGCTVGEGDAAVAYSGEDWGQNLDNDETPDAYPTLTGAKVYPVTNTGCPAFGEHTYTNTSGAETVNKAHVYVNGFCTNASSDGTVCDAYQPAVYSESNARYEISNAGQLYWFAALVNGDTTATGGVAQNKAANAVLTADITVNADLMKKITVAENGTAEVNEGENLRIWTPIGTGYTASYIGTFDGGNKTISGLYFNNSEVDYVGLFGFVDTNGTVQNVGVVDSYFCGSSYVGGVVGNNYEYGTVTNCYNTGTVSGSYSVGGVVGLNRRYATVTGCTNTGSVTGSDNVGGVVGSNTGTVTNCYNTGSVTGSGNSVGGVVGYNYGTVEKCHNAGSVTGSGNSVGGVVGYSGRSVTNCYNTGAVTGGSYVGGVVGSNYGGSVTNCYNKGTVTGNDGGNSVGGVAGNNTGTVANCYYLTGCAADGNKTTQYGIGNGTKGSTTADVADSTTGMSAAQFASGEVAYLLQGEQTEQVWGQNLDNGETPDAAPNFTGAKVYQLTNCKGEAGGYSNTENATGVHSYGAPVYTWSEDPIKLTVSVTCTLCDETLEGSTTDMNVTTSDDGLTTTYTATVRLDGKDYTDSHRVTNTVASVNITWGEMSFTYTDGTGWDNPNTARVQVENTGNTGVSVTYEYVTERRDIAGSFSDGTSTITDPVDIAPEDSKKIWLRLDGRPNTALNNTIIGTVKLTIE